MIDKQVAFGKYMPAQERVKNNGPAPGLKTTIIAWRSLPGVLIECFPCQLSRSIVNVTPGSPKVVSLKAPGTMGLRSLMGRGGEAGLPPEDVLDGE